ncbi:MAG: nucleotidyltransferase domain-containing protein [candidate division WOR-3 bacterium]
MIRNKRITQKIEPRLPLLAEALRQESDVIFTYLFGSYGKGKVSPLSDIDIAVYLDKNKVNDIFERKLELNYIVTSVLKTDEVDLIVLNEASLPLIHQVLMTGRLLFSKDEATRITFEVKAQKLYFDAEPLRRISWLALKERLKDGRFGH